MWRYRMSAAAQVSSWWSWARKWSDAVGDRMGLGGWRRWRWYSSSLRWTGRTSRGTARIPKTPKRSRPPHLHSTNSKLKPQRKTGPAIKGWHVMGRSPPPKCDGGALNSTHSLTLPKEQDWQWMHTLALYTLLMTNTVQQWPYGWRCINMWLRKNIHQTIYIFSTIVLDFRTLVPKFLDLLKHSESHKDHSLPHNNATPALLY